MGPISYLVMSDNKQMAAGALRFQLLYMELFTCCLRHTPDEDFTSKHVVIFCPFFIVLFTYLYKHQPIYVLYDFVPLTINLYICITLQHRTYLTGFRGVHYLSCCLHKLRWAFFRKSASTVNYRKSNTEQYEENQYNM